MNKFKNASWCGSLLKELGKFQKEGSGCDVKIRGSDDVFLKGHSVLLSVASSVIQAKLKCNPDQAIFVEDITSSTWKYVLDFVYSGKLKLSHVDYEDVKSAAKKLKMAELINALNRSEENRNDLLKKLREERANDEKLVPHLDAVDEVFPDSAENSFANIAYDADDDRANTLAMTEKQHERRSEFYKKVGLNKRKYAISLKKLEGKTYTPPRLRLIQYSATDIMTIRRNYEELYQKRKSERQLEKEMNEEYINTAKKEKTVEDRPKKVVEVKKKNLENITHKNTPLRNEDTNTSPHKYSTRKKQYKYSNDGSEPVEMRDDSKGTAVIKSESLAEEPTLSASDDATENVVKTHIEIIEIKQNKKQGDEDNCEKRTDDTLHEEMEEDSAFADEDSQDETQYETQDEEPEKISQRKKIKRKKARRYYRDDAIYPSDIKTQYTYSWLVKDEMKTITMEVLQPYVLSEEFFFEEIDLSDVSIPEKKKQSHLTRKGYKCTAEPVKVSEGIYKGETWYKCATCNTDETFPSKTQASNHKLIRNFDAYRSEPLTVVEKVTCPYFFEWEEIYRCKSCFKILQSKEKAASHLGVGSDGFVAACSYVMPPTRQIGDLFRCALCNKLFADQKGYDLHVSQESNCRGNQLKSRRPELLDKANAKYECQRCGLKFKDEASAELHASRVMICKPKTPIVLVCERCGLHFDSHKKLSIHLNAIITCRPQAKNGDYIEKKHFCRVCDYSCETTSKLILHAKGKHYDNIQEALGPYNHGCYVCQICNATIKKSKSRGGQYYEHLWIAHEKKIDLKNSYFQCEVCEFRTCNSYDYDRHLALHPETADAKYMCNKCGKNFPSYDGMRTHMLKVHSEKKYICEYCQKGFKIPGHLQAHLPSHTGMLPYQCNVCKMKFANGAAANNHISSVHGIAKSDAINYRTYTRYKCNTVKLLETPKKIVDKKVSAKTPIEPKKYRKLNHKLVGTCRFCGKQAPIRQTELHLSTHTGKLPFKCKLCDFMVGYVNGIEYHVMQEHGIDRTSTKKHYEYVRHPENTVRPEEKEKIPIEEWQSQLVAAKEARSKNKDKKKSHDADGNSSVEDLADLADNTAMELNDDATVDESVLREISTEVNNLMEGAENPPIAIVANGSETGGDGDWGEMTADTSTAYYQIVDTDQMEGMEIQYENMPSGATDTSGVQIQYVNEHGEAVELIEAGDGVHYQFVMEDGVGGEQGIELHQ